MLQLSVLAQLPPPVKFQLFSKSAAASAQLVPAFLAIACSYLHSTQDYDQQFLVLKWESILIKHKGKDTVY